MAFSAIYYTIIPGKNVTVSVVVWDAIFNAKTPVDLWIVEFRNNSVILGVNNSSQFAGVKCGAVESSYCLINIPTLRFWKNIFDTAPDVIPL